MTATPLTVPAAAATRFHLYLARRLNGEPVSRILGEREFYGRVCAMGVWPRMLVAVVVAHYCVARKLGMRATVSGFPPSRE